MCGGGGGGMLLEREREGGRGEGGRRRWVVHDEKRKGKTFVEGPKRGGILLEERGGKRMQVSLERNQAPKYCVGGPQ